MTDYTALLAALGDLERVNPGDPDNAWMAVFMAEARNKTPIICTRTTRARVRFVRLCD